MDGPAAYGLPLHSFSIRRADLGTRCRAKTVPAAPAFDYLGRSRVGIMMMSNNLSQSTRPLDAAPDPCR